MGFVRLLPRSSSRASNRVVEDELDAAMSDLEPAVEPDVFDEEFPVLETPLADAARNYAAARGGAASAH